MALNVLVLGSGGREHALAWKISQSPLLNKLYCLPGNPGTEELATNLFGKVDDFDCIAKAVAGNDIDLVVVGPENPLVDGLRDFLCEIFPNLMIVGPSASGARLEGSKDFAKDFMSKYGIPTAAYRTFDAATIDEAYAFLRTLQPPYVLKADGLAGGKGVIIEQNLEAAEAALKEMFSGKFGSASAKVVIEQFLSGIEVSVFVLTDGKDYLVLPEAKDYKRIGEGDTGLNTGGMGAVSPVPFADGTFMRKVEERVVKPTLSGLSAEGIDYKGFIFLGLMNCSGDPYVIEYNVRMGDPETEAVMTRIKSDLLSHMVAAAKGCIADEKLVLSEQSAVTVVMVSGGYPEKYASAYQIKGLGNTENCVVFHSGTKKDPLNGIVTAGGRVLAVTANADDVRLAKEAAFARLKNICFKDCYFRHDIADDIINLYK